jgi:hypothetical protein
VYVGAGIRLRAVEGRGAGHAEGDLGEAELPADGAAPFGRLLLDDYLCVWVVELDGELVGENGLRRGCDAAILAYLLLRECRVRPAGLCEHLAEEDVRADGVRVAGGGRGGVDVVQSVVRLGVGAVLGEQEGLTVLVGLVGRLEKESCVRVLAVGSYR